MPEKSKHPSRGRGRPAGSRNGDLAGVPGVIKVGARYRVRFGARNSYGTYATVEAARAAALAVVEYRDRHGHLPKVPDARVRRAAARADSRTGVKGVQAIGGVYRVRFKVGGRLVSFGTFPTFDEAKARAAQVQADRARGLDVPPGAPEKPAQCG